MSNFDNCVLYNAILKDGNPFDNKDVNYLIFLQGLHEQAIAEYYDRSERLIRKMRELGVDNGETWSEIDRVHVTDIIELIKEKNYAEVPVKIREMIENLESQYGVE